jgi:type 2 lantibiotic biosynthesis protein LanM
MHIARLEERLSGDTPEARFQNFIHALGQPERAYAFLREYPVLARSVVTLIHHWADYSLEIAQHLCTDWSDLGRVFAQGTDLGNLVEVHTGAGDTHRQGRSVALLRFSSGFQLVYKPRSLLLDQHFQEVLAWVNQLGLTQPLRTTAILDAGSHGWVEFVQPRDCSTRDEVSHFYERQGSYLALLYALDATDFHYENVLAAGEHPVLVDLEALFHSRLGEDDPDAGGSAARSIGYSVLRAGLLPSRRLIEEGDAGVDMSGLGGQEGQVTPPVPIWKEEATDQMRLARERRTLSASKNRPKLLGEEVQASHYAADLLKGFTEMYRLLVRHQEGWLTRILPRFERDEVRVILRDTRTYMTLVSEGFHPEYLGDALERERLFDHLWDGVSLQPHLRRVIAAERRDLLQGDVPLFTTHPGSRDLLTSQGERIEDFCPESGLEFARRRIKAMGEGDLALQQWIIQASLVSTVMGNHQLSSVPFRSSSAPAVAREQLLQAASSIGARLNALAVRGERGVNWLGIDAVTESQGGTIWLVQPGGLKLYDGLPGIVLFLSYLAHLTGEAGHLELADQALLTLQEQLDRSRPFETSESIGAFSGLGSLIYLFAHLFALRGERAFLQQAYALAEEVEPLIEHDKRFDIIAGSAGLLTCLLALYAVTPSPRVLEVAIRCGEHLLAQAQSLAGGLGWYTLRPGIAPTGFSHGTAGIALSLFQLAEASRQERFRLAALAALAYERSLFSPEQGNWPRLLEQGMQEFSVTWCHGAPGIGLARLASLRYDDDEQMRQEIQIALATTRKQGFGNNQSICHGDLGNLETLLVAAHVLDHPADREELNRLTALIFDGMQEHGWVSGVPLGVETPGLMTGLAGMGYELLRLCAPESVPSVLLLAPPCLDVGEPDAALPKKEGTSG